jgi:hypothetical protein
MIADVPTHQDVIRICNTTSIMDRTREIRRFFPSLGLKGSHDVACKSNEDIIKFFKPYLAETIPCPHCEGTGRIKNG